MGDVSGSDSPENVGSERVGAESRCGGKDSFEGDVACGEKRKRAWGVGGRTGVDEEGEPVEVTAGRLDEAFALGRERSRARGRLEGTLVGCTVLEGA